MAMCGLYYGGLLKLLAVGILVTLGGACDYGLKEYISDHHNFGCVDTSINVPCRGNLVRVEDSRNYYCTDCGVIKKTQGCCGDQIFDIERWTCCGGNLIDVNIFSCCHGKPVDRLPTHGTPKRSRALHGDQCCVSGRQNVGSGDTDCCGDISYNTTTHSCCGRQVVSSRNYLCCQNTPVKVNPEVDMMCCGGQAYESQKNYRCEGSKLVPKDAPPLCGERFLLGNQQCCEGETHPLNDETTKERRHCCGVFSFVKSTQICIKGMGRVLPKPKSSTPKPQSSQPKKECGGEAYDPGSKVCCWGELYDKFDENNEGMTCCGITAINSRTHRCSNGRSVLKCPFQLPNNVTNDLGSLRKFLAVRTGRTKYLNCTLTGTKISCKNLKVSIEVTAGKWCLPFHKAYKSGETLIIPVTDESGERLDLTDRHAWTFCSGCGFKKIRRLARKKSRDLREMGSL